MRRAHQTSLWMLIGGLAAMLGANIALWHHVRPIKAIWTNVPPAPSQIMASSVALGDTQMAYRIYGIMIQNFGDTGGRTTALKDYDYDALASWFRLEHALDPQSRFMPFLAGFVYGGSQDPEKLRPLIDYLALAAGDGQGYSWRWMAQAVHLARFKLKDTDLAYQLATKLAAMYRPDMPAWVLQMPAFVLNEGGDKKAAMGLMLSILKSGEGQLQQAEVNAMIDYICDQIMSPDEAAKSNLCAEIP